MPSPSSSVYFSGICIGIASVFAVDLIANFQPFLWYTGVAVLDESICVSFLFCAAHDCHGEQDGVADMTVYGLPVPFILAPLRAPSIQ
jgi:hypothetical protein